MKPLGSLDAGNAYLVQIKPFSFLLIAHAHPFGHAVGHAVGVNPAHFQVIPPFETDPGKWLSLRIDRPSGRRVAITTDRVADAPDAARVQTYRDVVRDSRTHPEAKSAGSQRQPCRPDTRRLLQRWVVHESTVVLVGKETNRLEEVEAGAIHD